MPESSPLSEICYGPMKSGKSLYLIEKSQFLFHQAQSFLTFKPELDTRDGSFIRSRHPQSRDVQALSIARSQDIWQIVDLALQRPQDFFHSLPTAPDQVLALRQAFCPEQRLQACLIDEVFLLDAELLNVLQTVMQAGVSVFLSGLDRDFRGAFFPLRQLGTQTLSMADVIQFCQQARPLQALCECCGQPAELTQRLINGQPAPYHSPTVLIGDEEYQPRCQAHHELSDAPHLSAAS